MFVSSSSPLEAPSHEATSADTTAFTRRCGLARVDSGQVPSEPPEPVVGPFTETTAMSGPAKAATTPPVNTTFARTQSGPPETIRAVSSSSRESPNPGASSSSTSSWRRCDHCLAVEQRRVQARAAMKLLVASCQELVDVIRSRFHADTCVCYPSAIEESDLVRTERYAQMACVEFLQHLLRLVRPGASEHEQRAPNSRLVRHTATSKVIVPIMIQRDTGLIVELGFPNCFAVPRRPNVQECEGDLRILEIVIDYEPPSEFATNVFRSSPPLWPLPHRLSHDFRAEADLLFPTKSGTTTTTTMQPQASSSSSSRPSVDVTRPFPNQIPSSVTVQSRRSVPVNLHRYETLFSDHHLPSTLPWKLHVQSGLYSTRGRRQRMEDRLFVTEDLHASCGLPPLPGGEKIAFFGLYDGHGGTEVVDFVANSLHHCFCQSDGFAAGDYPRAFYETFERVEKQAVSRLSRLCCLTRLHRRYLKRCGLTRTAQEPAAPLSPSDPPTPSHAVMSPSLDHLNDHDSLEDLSTTEIEMGSDSLSEKIRDLESEVARLEAEYGLTSSDVDALAEGDDDDDDDADEPPLTSGSTALVIVVRGTKVFIANLGDSRCILSRGGRIACLTEDHRLRSSARECERVRKTPGTFSYDGYLCGQLGVSRAFGNIQRKAGKKLLGLSSCPDVIHFELRPDDEFLVAGCDGVFDTVAATDVAFSVQASLNSSRDPTLASKELVELAVINHSDDNVSAIVVWFHGDARLKASRQLPALSLQPVMSTGALLRSDASSEAAPMRRQISRPSRYIKGDTDPTCLGRRSQSQVACCRECTCAALQQQQQQQQHIVDGESKEGTPAASNSARRPYVRKRYCWNVVQTP